MIHFELLLPAHGLAGSIWSAVDVLRELNSLARLRTARKEPVVSWRVIDSEGRPHRFHAITCTTAQERRHHKNRDDVRRVLLVPPLETSSLPELYRLIEKDAAALDTLRRAHDEGALLGACGTGVWLLAHGGMIEKAPVPWLYQSGFAAYFPALHIESRLPFVDGPRTLCAATPSLLYALVLRIIARAGEADLAHAVAEKLMFNDERQGLSAEMTTEQIMGASRDTPLYLAMSWMRSHLGSTFRLAEVAQAAATSERTLSRLFQRHLGQSPLQYIQEQRVKRAEMWLEGTWRSVGEIAQDCGYNDVSAFCRMFTRATGVSPQRYRERYNFRGPRAAWKAKDPTLPKRPSATTEK
jgi:transcriptional regulator GlxA family with amidase domain